MKPNGEKSNGFTLVELVVVAAIVAIFFAVFLPAWLRANRPTGGIQCLSNMKQLALAAQMYATDNDDYLPNANGPAGLGLFFAGRLAPYVGVTFDESRGLDQAHIADVCRQAPVFRCPAWPQRSSQNKDIGLHYTINGIKYESRSQPAAPAGAARSPDLKRSDLPASLGQIALFLELSAHRKFINYSECAVIDASTSTFDKNGKRNTRENARMIWGGDRRHLGKSTVAFMDGHREVRALTKEEMGYKKILNPLDEQARY